MKTTLILVLVGALIGIVAASFVVPPTGLSANALARDGSLRFDLANRDSDRAGIIFDISPGNITSFAFTYLHNMDTYNDTFYNNMGPIAPVPSSEPASSEAPEASGSAAP